MEAPRVGEDVKTASLALVVLPRTCGTATRVPCLVGPEGTVKTSLAVAVADALGCAHVRVALDEHHTEQVIRGKEGVAPGRVVRGLRKAGVRNPAFILELLDEVKPEVADALLDVLEPVVGSAFQDRYLQTAVRSVVGPLDRDGGRSEGDPRADAPAPGGDRAVGLHRTGEAAHRRTVPVEAGVRGDHAGVGRVPGAGSRQRRSRSSRRTPTRPVRSSWPSARCRRWQNCRRCRPGRRFPPPTHGRLPRRARSVSSPRRSAR